MILLDTDVLSGLRARSDGPLHRWLARQGERPCLSVYSVTELQFGIAKVRPRDPSFADVLAAWLDTMLAINEAVPFDVPAARLTGTMKAVSELAHLEGDLLIAATAIVAGMPLATLNQRHFRLIARHFPALVVVDPLAPG